MIKAVSVARDGECSQVTVRHLIDGTWSMQGKGRRRIGLHMQHELSSVDLVLLSPMPPEQLFAEEHTAVVEASVVEASLPAPLSTYIYPAPLIIVRLDRDTKKPITMNEETLCEICANLISESQAARYAKAAVYDVPAMPIGNNPEDNESMFAEDEEEDQGYDCNERESDGDLDEDDDEDWDDDDLSLANGLANGL